MFVSDELCFEDDTAAVAVLTLSSDEPNELNVCQTIVAAA